MHLEALGKPLRYKLRSGEEILLEPGHPIDLPEQSALSLLKQAGARVRVARSQWLQAWREVVALSAGLTADDPRLPPVRAALTSCDAAFEQDDWVAFQESKHEVIKVMLSEESG